ncbi:MAG: hypothetical protein WCO61_04070 [Alphaproteobacteria bacterium]
MTREKIISILLYEWDPIGIADVPQARDEYDAYVNSIAALVSKRIQKEEIARALLDIERDEMGLSGDFPRALRVAEKLLALNSQ